MNKSNIVTIAVAFICVILAGSLIGVMANYSSALNTKDNTITNQDLTIKDLKSQLASQDNQLREDNSTIAALNSQVTSQVSK